MKILINKTTGKLICASAIDFEPIETEMFIDEIYGEDFENPYFDFETRTFYNKIDE